MKVIVVGCGRVGPALAYQLHREGHQVTVIDQDSAAFDQLSLDFRGRTIKGDVLDRNVLRRAQVEEADALAAVTRSDSLNALVAHVARTEYRVARCVARNADPRQRALQEALGVAIVGSQDWGAQRMMELLSDAPRRVDLEEGGSEFAVTGVGRRAPAASPPRGKPIPFPQSASSGGRGRHLPGRRPRRDGGGVEASAH